MHLADGVISSIPVLVGGFAAAGVGCAWSAYKIRDEEIPSVAVFTAAFFVVSLIHIPAGPGSVHLIFNGLIGVVLRRRSFLVFPIGLFLQAAVLGHGGVSGIGINCCGLGIPALLSWIVYDGLSARGQRWIFLSGAVGAGLGVLGSGVLFMAVLLSMGENFSSLATMVFLAHLPVALLEGMITGFTVQFLSRVQPVLIGRQ